MCCEGRGRRRRPRRPLSPSRRLLVCANDWRKNSWTVEVADLAVENCMTTNNDLDPSAPSHDDVSNSGTTPQGGIPEFDNESHDLNDDAPSNPPSGSGEQPAPEEKI